jgi:DMSO reductase anchor subunit
MSRIYIIPTQIAWNTPATVLAYYKSALLLGSLATGSLLPLGLKFAIIRRPGEHREHRQVIQAAFRWLPLVAVGAALLSVALELVQINALQDGDASAQASLKLWLGIYRPLFSIHLALMFAGVGVFAFTAWVTIKNRKAVYDLVAPTYIACLLIIISEILGRFLFYATHVRTGI